MNIGDLVVLVLLGLAVGLAAGSMWRRRKNGCGGCSGCSGCAQRGGCPSAQTETTKN